MKPLAVTFLMVGFVAFPLVAAGADLDRRLDSSLEAVVKAARQNEYGRLLVVVREMEGSQSRSGTPALLRQIETAILDACQAGQLTASTTAAAGKTLGEKSGRPPLTPEQIAPLLEDAPGAAVVAADLRIMGRRTTLRLALVDAERRQLFRTVRLADTPLPMAAQPEAPVAPDNSGTVPAGLIPPLTEGLSGYAKQAAGTGANAAATGDNDANAAGAAANAGETVAAATDINKAIVRFAVSRLGQQVGNGECWTLAAEALRAAGAEPPRRYDFGQEIDLDEITPGDILQFTSARFDNPNGGYYLMGAPNHTAVVYTVTGEQVFLLHQNFGTRTVTTLDINFNHMTSGDVQAYRALARE